MITSLRYIVLLGCICTVFALQPVVVRAKGRPITVTIPSTALHQTLNALLPLSLEQNRQKKQFEGTITLDSINTLEIKENMISLQGQVSGHNMKVTTNIGGQNIQLNLGQLVLPITCDIALRYDKKKKILFLTPYFRNPKHGRSNSAETLLPLLNGLTREYPLALDRLAPLSGQINSTIISVQMAMVDVQAVANQLLLKFSPMRKRNIKRVKK